MTKREAADHTKKRLARKYGRDPVEIIREQFASVICAECDLFLNAHDGAGHEFVSILSARVNDRVKNV